MKNLLLIALCVGSLAVVPACRKKRVVVETPNGEFVLDTPDKKTEKSHRVVKYTMKEVSEDSDLHRS